MRGELVVTQEAALGVRARIGGPTTRSPSASCSATPAARALVLRPLGITKSFFPCSWPARDAVTGYELTDDGRFEPVPPRACTIPVASAGTPAAAPAPPRPSSSA